MKSLVTGGAGFIGSHLVEKLIESGDKVMVVDNLSTGTLDNLDKIESDNLVIEIASVQNSPLIESAIRRFQPERVFHLAAQVSVPHSVKSPIGDFQTNALGATVVFEAAAKHNVKSIVFSSTGGAIYGEAEEVPTRETYPALPMSPYGQHKLLAETGAGFYIRQRGVDITVLRFANVYGPRQGGSGESGVISLFTSAAVDEKPVTIYGSGEQTRDFVYVADVVDALILASETKSDGGPYNIGSESEISINDLVQEMLGLGLKIDYRYAKSREGEVQRSSLSSAKAKKDLGWEAKTVFTSGLEATIDEMKRNPRKDRKEEIFCIDVGGSNISSALISEGNPVIEMDTIATSPDWRRMLDIVADKVGDKENWSLALPGTVSGRRYWTQSSAYGIMDEIVDLQKECASRGITAPLRAENDVFTLARGAALENLSINRLAVVNIGYGLGGALTISGWPQKGVAQEIGHIPLPGNDYLCPCGSRGCITTVLAGEFLEAEEEEDGFIGSDDYLEARRALLFLLQNIKLMLSPTATMLSGGSFWGIWEKELDSLEADLQESTLSSPGAEGILLAAEGPEVALRGLYDLSSDEDYPR